MWTVPGRVLWSSDGSHRRAGQSEWIRAGSELFLQQKFGLETLLKFIGYEQEGQLNLEKQGEKAQNKEITD